MHKTYPISIREKKGHRNEDWKQLIVHESIAGIVWRFLKKLGRFLTSWRAPANRKPAAPTTGKLFFSEPGKTPAIEVPATFDRSIAGVTTIEGKKTGGSLWLHCTLTLEGKVLSGTVRWGSAKRKDDKGGLDDGTEGIVEEEGNGG